MDVQSIQALAALMKTLGFSSTIDKQLIWYASFRQKEFSIKEHKTFGHDLMSYQIFFKKNEANENLVCTHYDASLRKDIQIQSATVNKIDLQKLDERMKGVNWQDVSQFKMPSELDLSDKKTWQQQASIEELILDLEVLASTDEGQIIADSLKYKYWVDIPLENMIPNLYLLRSKLEFAQRFYIISEDGITADEAFRFLNNRWRQRQVQSEKKKESLVGTDGSALHENAKQGRYKKRKLNSK